MEEENDVEDQMGPFCMGCRNLIEEGSVVAFGDGIWHVECFKCNKCGEQVECDSNLLLLSDGSPVCENCSYSCHICKQPIRDEAIMTGDEAYHADCFRCVLCHNKIEDLVFTQTSKGIFCTSCHEQRKAEKQRRREEKQRRLDEKAQLPSPIYKNYIDKSLPSLPSDTTRSLKSSPSSSPGDTSSGATYKLHETQAINDYFQTPSTKLSVQSTDRSASLDIPRNNRLQPPQSYPSSYLNAPSSQIASKLPTNPSNSTILNMYSDPVHDVASQAEATEEPRGALTFSFAWEKDSEELANLTKLLGSTLHVNEVEGVNTHEEEHRGPSLSIDGYGDIEVEDFPQPPPHSRRKFSNASQIAQLSPDDPQRVIAELKHELQTTKGRLKDTESQLNKIKDVSRRALDEFNRAKEEFSKEVAVRQMAEKLIQQLKLQLAASQAGAEGEPLRVLQEEQARLSQNIAELKSIRDKMVTDMEQISTRSQSHSSNDTIQQLEALKQSYFTQIASLRGDRDFILQETTRLSKIRDDALNDTVMLTTKNAELNTMNNDLSRRVTEREREAAAVIAGTSFLNQPDASKRHPGVLERTSQDGFIGGHVRQSSETQNIGTVRRIVQRDSFNGTQNPTIFKFKRNKGAKTINKSGGGKSEIGDPRVIPYTPLNGYSGPSRKDQRAARQQQSQVGIQAALSNESHRFQQVSFLRPVKCNICDEKIWGLNELRCQGCGFVVHAKCAFQVPSVCSGDLNDNSFSSGDSGYYKASMFGNELERQVESEGRDVPILVSQCIHAVEVRGMDYEGIYRKSGGAGQMRSIQILFESGEIPDLADVDEYNDICAVTSVLKQYLRELPIPLMTYDMYPEFIEAAGQQNGEGKLSTFYEIVHQLPKAYYDTLKCLMLHLDNVREQSAENLMTAKNLSVIFGPTLMRSQNPSDDLIDMNNKNTVIEYLINNCKALFEEEHVREGFI
ncbi:hypothetical protein BZG36_01112 [Bifiguratus adelaidae]|uniref:RhoGAP-domain-containing protein n=1 Tax=Bifiguratus adelaidae TaxID=1938954 RepID=A0A261Y652_9FUNG|nr:hypothetical protein BZG36_01112 [Bifiguratus adelaidae]